MKEIMFIKSLLESKTRKIITPIRVKDVLMATSVKRTKNTLVPLNFEIKHNKSRKVNKKRIKFHKISIAIV